MRKAVAALKAGTHVELYKDGHREVFHHTAREVFTHPDTPEWRASCEACVKLAESRRKIRPDHRLDREAEDLMARTADPREFDELRKRGWPGSEASGSAILDPCGSECGICNPTVEHVRASARRAASQRRMKR